MKSALLAMFAAVAALLLIAVVERRGHSSGLAVLARADGSWLYAQA